MPMSNLPPKKPTDPRQITALESARAAEGLPPMLPGHDTPVINARVRSFLGSVAAMFEAWVSRRENPNTQRAYRTDVMDFVRFKGIRWPDDDWQILKSTIPDVQEWRRFMVEVEHRAPKTILRRITSLSRFYEYMREQAAEFRLPLIVPNPAHKTHIPRDEAQPVSPTKELTASRVRQLKQAVVGDDLLAHRDRAVIWFYLYTGARIGTGCRLRIEDCHFDDFEDPYVLIQEKGKGTSRRKVGLNAEAAEVIQEYIAHAGLTSGPLFRARKSSRSAKLSDRSINAASMYRLIQEYLAKLPRATREVELHDGSKVRRCVYTPHSLRATTATQADEAGVPVTAIQELLGHSQLKTTQTYIKRRRTSKESASHRLPF